jgi:outer membrane protein OmpA-like peptidoglycan-associated protein
MRQTIHASWLPLAALLLGGCAAAVKPDGADTVRQQLAALQSDRSLAPLVADKLMAAEAAVLMAETPTRDIAGGQHAVFVAQRKIELARSDAERQIAERELRALELERQAIISEGQRQELEMARSQAEAAAAAALAHEQAAALARQQALAAQAMTAELRRQMELLEAKATDRGMVMTLGDVLFAVGKSDLQAAAAERLDKLAIFMHRYVDRRLTIEGHTDAQGTAENNLALSQRRAEAVKAYLISQSVAAERMETIGKGMDVPVADNSTPEGRQQNRRVEIIISNAAEAG